MNRDLFLALISMDSYNRGYDRSVKFSPGEAVGPRNEIGATIGNATVSSQSGIFTNSADVAADFYAIAYDWQGEKVIAYRGTDNFTVDGFYGYPIGAGFEAVQGGMAIAFYQSVVGNVGRYSINPNVTVTGHSLDGESKLH